MSLNESRRSCKRRWIGAAVFLGLVMAFLLVFHRFLFLDNFAVVDPGRAYRSAQLKSGVDQTIETYHLRSILNLRGGSPKDPWYAAEVAATEHEGITYYDLPMSAVKRPTRTELLELVDVLQRGPYPMLIHCKSGSDRTGLASSLYRLVVLGEPPEQAENAFSIWRGHVPLFGPEHLHEPLHEYAAWLKEHGERHTPATFRTWLTTTYRSKGPDRPFTPLPSGPRAKRQHTVDRISASI